MQQKAKRPVANCILPGDAGLFGLWDLPVQPPPGEGESVRSVGAEKQTATGGAVGAATR